MADQVQYDAVPEQRVIVEKQRYFDGVVRTIAGKDIPLARQKLHLRILKTVRLKNLHTEGALANYLGLNMRDEVFQESLAQLETFGMIVRKTREWGFRGEWIELAEDDRKVDNTARGDGLSVDVREVIDEKVKCEGKKEA